LTILRRVPENPVNLWYVLVLYDDCRVPKPVTRDPRLIDGVIDAIEQPISHNPQSLAIFLACFNANLPAIFKVFQNKNSRQPIPGWPGGIHIAHAWQMFGFSSRTGLIVQSEYSHDGCQPRAKKP
jgi:hypothetical protein